MATIDPQGFPRPTSGSWAFTPYKPPPIPAGYYDPSLDAQRQAASRGLVNTEQDVALAQRRGSEDYETGQADVNRTAGRTSQDIETQRGYSKVDYERNIEMLTRQYKQQGRQQAERARQYGVTSGGIALLSAAKRQENEGLERRDLDTGYERQVAGYDTAEQRNTEDAKAALDRLRTGYDRGVADLGTELSRARSEDLFYGQDVEAQKSYQATQAGYAAPTGPSNEFRRPDGTAYRVVVKNGVRYEVDPSGKILNQRRA